MTDQVITPEMAVTLHAEGIQRRELPAWIVFQAEPDYPGKVIARFETETPTPVHRIAWDAAAGAEENEAPLSRSTEDLGNVVRAINSEALMRAQTPTPVPPRALFRPVRSPRLLPGRRHRRLLFAGGTPLLSSTGMHFGGW
jgi:hypothetical protein